ncbi:MAG: biotin--[acetyl-CoA-carboxylase] ligase [Saprospiraceae bacterium]|nr:biotin--[acetyl-CoA-carboxylase] ligase [Saprospiraceae bacterium]
MLPSNNTVGRIRLHFKSLESTNDFATGIVSKINPSDGLVVSTDFQSKGRGQFGRKWDGVAGQNVAMTAILRPQSLKADHQFFLSKMAAVAVCETLSELKISNIGIKWPNDIVVDGEKICGILIQNTITGKEIKWSVVGIGINVLQRKFEGEFNRKPTSVVLKSPYEDAFDVRSVESILLKQLNALYNQLKMENFGRIDDMYHHWLEKIGENIRYKLMSENAVKTGILDSVDKSGHICILHQGKLLRYAMGDISILSV